MIGIIRIRSMFFTFEVIVFTFRLFFFILTYFIQKKYMDSGELDLISTGNWYKIKSNERCPVSAEWRVTAW